MASTKNKVFLRVGFCAMLLALLMGFAPARALAVSFSTDTTFGNKWTVTPLGEGRGGFEMIEFDGVEGDLVITNLKSSNKRVATVSKSDNEIWIDYGSTVGSTTISCTVNGVNLSKVFRVKYTSPIKRFTVAGKNLTTKFRKKNVFTDNKTYKNKKVVIKAKTGWVITGVENIKGFKHRTTTYAKGKSSLTIKIKTVAPSDGLRITFTNKKTGEEQEVDYLRSYKGTRYSPVAG